MERTRGVNIFIMIAMFLGVVTLVASAVILGNIFFAFIGLVLVIALVFHIACSEIEKKQSKG